MDSSGTDGSGLSGRRVSPNPIRKQSIRYEWIGVPLTSPIPYHRARRCYVHLKNGKEPPTGRQNQAGRAAYVVSGEAKCGRYSA